MLVNTNVQVCPMKPQLLTSVLTISALTAATTLTAIETTVAQTTAQFVCSTSNGIPATVAKTANGEVPVILWSSDYFNSAGYTPESRCQQVSNRFQTYYGNGSLKFMTTGRINRQNVVCVAELENGPCSGLLFTLKPGSNPTETLQELLARRSQSGGPLNETGARVYIDMNHYLQEGLSATTAIEPTIGFPDESSSSINSNPQVNPQPAPQPAPQPNPGYLW